METTRIIGGIAFVAAFFAASLLALWITGCIERSRHGSEAALLSGADSSRMQHLLRNGIPSLKPLSNELLKIRVIERFIKRLQNALAERDTETYPQSLASLLLGGALAILILGSALSASFVFALTALICALLFLNSWITKQQDSYHARLREELPSAIQAMNACFCIGYSLPQIFEQDDAHCTREERLEKSFGNEREHTYDQERHDRDDLRGKLGLSGLGLQQAFEFKLVIDRLAYDFQDL